MLQDDEGPKRRQQPLHESFPRCRRSHDILDDAGDAPGNISGKTAQACTQEEILAEVWGELKRHLNDMGVVHLADHNLVHSYLADSFWRLGDMWVNDEPLLINTAGSCPDPEPDPCLDYVRTHTDVASMEAASEAAHRATSGILEAAGSSAPQCRIWELDEPLIFAPLKRLDRKLFRRGLPHPFYNPKHQRPARFRFRRAVTVASCVSQNKRE